VRITREKGKVELGQTIRLILCACQVTILPFLAALGQIPKRIDKQVNLSTNPMLPNSQFFEVIANNCGHNPFAAVRHIALLLCLCMSALCTCSFPCCLALLLCLCMSALCTCSFPCCPTIRVCLAPLPRGWGKNNYYRN